MYFTLLKQPIGNENQSCGIRKRPKSRSNSHFFTAFMKKTLLKLFGCHFFFIFLMYRYSLHNDDNSSRVNVLGHKCFRFFLELVSTFAYGTGSN